MFYLVRKNILENFRIYKLYWNGIFNEKFKLIKFKYKKKLFFN